MNKVADTLASVTKIRGNANTALGKEEFLKTTTGA
jgi:hypothetical protein